MSKHTPGPWHISSEGIGCRHVRSVPVGTSICWTDGLSQDNEDDANANLIAAAPDLLEALERILEDNPGCMCANCEEGWRLVRKVKGEEG